VLVASDTGILINVAENSLSVAVDGVKNAGDLGGGRDERGHLNGEVTIDRAGSVGEDGTANGRSVGLGLGLPEPKDVVNLGVVQEEEGIGGGGPDVVELDSGQPRCKYNRDGYVHRHQRPCGRHRGHQPERRRRSNPTPETSSSSR